MMYIIVAIFLINLILNAIIYKKIQDVLAAIPRATNPVLTGPLPAINPELTGQLPVTQPTLSQEPECISRDSKVESDITKNVISKINLPNFRKEHSWSHGGKSKRVCKNCSIARTEIINTDGSRVFVYTKAGIKLNVKEGEIPVCSNC